MWRCPNCPKFTPNDALSPWIVLRRLNGRAHSYIEIRVAIVRSQLSWTCSASDVLCLTEVALLKLQASRTPPLCTRSIKKVSSMYDER